MKRAWIVAVALVVVSTAGFAQSPSPAPLSREALAAILGPPGSNLKSACTATAQCASGTVSCSGNSNCSTQDRDCAVPTSGKVTCDGVTTWCSTACSVCDECAATGDCVKCCQCQGFPFLFCSRSC